MTQPAALRECFLAGLPNATDSAAELEMPPPAQIYVPQTHKRALSPDQPLVIGGRGAGKTLWHSALLDETHRTAVARAFGLRELEGMRVSPGFMTGKDSADRFPSPRTLRQLRDQNRRPSDIWQAVVLRAVSASSTVPTESWAATVAFVADNGEAVDQLLREADTRLIQEGARHLILFDALDRVAPESWEHTQELMRGLLMVALDARGYRAIRLKIFARPDMIERGPATSFPDASKIVGNPVELDWSRADLYGLLWQYLGNAQDRHGQTFREFAIRETQGDWPVVDGYFPVPPALRSGESVQENLFKGLAGPHMGGGPKRGNTYLWLPNHLADEKQYVSPRSFIVALRVAAEKTSQDHPTALAWRAIQEGVRVASNRRTTEIETDLPWVDKAMKPLKGLNVPCTVADVEERWRLRKVMQEIAADTLHLPPPHFAAAYPVTLLNALVAQGICRKMQDGRLNMPDIYRVAYGLLRRGGLPVKR